MTQDVATTNRAPAAAEASSSPPKLSAGLEWRVDRFLRLGDLTVATLTDQQRQEARDLSVAYARFMAPAGFGRIERWMDMVAFGVTNPPERENRAARIALIAETSGDLPIACWTRETRAAFARHRGVEGRFWPSDAEVDAFLRPMATKLRWTASALAEMGKEPEPRPAPPSEPTEEEKAAVSAKVQEAIAAMGEGFRSQREPVQPRGPSRLTGRDLWESRNRSRAASGMPPLPEPTTFEGYGTLPPEGGTSA